MSAFEGWIIKFNGTELPVTYMDPSGYSVEPDTDNIANDWTDEAGHYHPDEYEHKRTKITIKIKKELHQDDIEKIFEIIKKGQKNGLNEYIVSYWHTKDCVYKNGYFRMDDIKQEMKKVDPKHKDIIYNSFTLKFTEN